MCAAYLTCGLHYTIYQFYKLVRTSMLYEARCIDHGSHDLHLQHFCVIENKGMHQKYLLIVTSSCLALATVTTNQKQTLSLIVLSEFQMLASYQLVIYFVFFSLYKKDCLWHLFFETFADYFMQECKYSLSFFFKMHLHFRITSVFFMIIIQFTLEIKVYFPVIMTKEGINCFGCYICYIIMSYTRLQVDRLSNFSFYFCLGGQSQVSRLTIHVKWCLVF